MIAVIKAAVVTIRRWAGWLAILAIGLIYLSFTLSVADSDDADSSLVAKAKSDLPSRLDPVTENSTVLADPFAVPMPAGTVYAAALPMRALVSEPIKSAGQSKAISAVCPVLRGIVSCGAQQIALIEYEAHSSLYREQDKVANYSINAIDADAVKLVDPKGNTILLKVRR